MIKPYSIYLRGTINPDQDGLSDLLAYFYSTLKSVLMGTFGVFIAHSGKSKP